MYVIELFQLSYLIIFELQNPHQSIKIILGKIKKLVFFIYKNAYNSKIVYECKKLIVKDLELFLMIVKV